MKTICVLLIVAFTLHGVDSNAQRITFSKKDASMNDVFQALEKQAGYTFLIDKAWISQTKKVAVNVIDGTADQVLEQYFKDQPFSYSIVEKLVIIQQKGGTPNPDPPPLLNIDGKIINESGEAIPGVSVTVKGTRKATITDDNGEFRLAGVRPNATLVTTSINYERNEVIVANKQEILVIQLKKQVNELVDVVVVSNGYKKENKEELTGSYAKVNNELLNRSVSTGVLERLDGVTSGLLFNKNLVLGLNQSSISVRGRTTIYGNPEPLIVVDNFPYTGDINNINPNDVESITVLKDAAATAIWGTLAGNGVIVITTKTGKYNQLLKVSFNSNITIGNKPDLYYLPILSSSDYIDLEQYLFSQNFYLAKETNPYHPTLSPVVEILIKKRDGLISSEDAASSINILRNQDIRNDKEKYFYRKSINQQYAANVSGGSLNYQYYLSAGYDKNLSNLVGNEYNRKTFTANNTFLLLNKKLELSAGIIFTESSSKENNSSNFQATYPYLKLVDENGKALPVPADLRQSYKDTAGHDTLLGWDLRPFDELHLQDNLRSLIDYRINIGLKFIIIEGFDVNIIYQHNKGFSDLQNFQSQQTYYTRNLINKFTEIDTAGKLIQHIPKGGIFDKGNSKYEANNLRAQLNYNHSWGKLHTLTAIAGAEVRNITTQFSISRLYGYRKETQTGTFTEYQKDFPVYYAPFSRERIPFMDDSKGTTDHYISCYFNATYTYKNRYALSTSVRKDESNIFGVRANQKGVPLWSTGIGWTISRESFYHIAWLPFLKLRTTGGYNGNVDKSVSAYTTANIDGLNPWNSLYGAITNPPNSALRWEKIYMMNIGLDFATQNKRIEGSLEFYSRTGKDLIGYSPVDPTTGNTTFRGNTANMKGQGFDITLNTRNINKQIKWYSTIIMSKATDKVTAYKVKQSTIDNYLKASAINPLEGNPLYSIYSMKWMGLDPQNGDPLGYFNGQISKDYSAILGSSDFNNLQYRGPANPTIFGSLRNTFSWKQLEFSFNITWKAGYYFRRNSINYNSLFNAITSHSDFSYRWQKPGDEKFTNIPSLRYPQDANRDPFYSYSDILVEKGDHIRLQDIQISYDISKKDVSKLPMQLIRLYLYSNNIGILWKANNKGIDPDYISSIPNPRTIAVGIKVDF